VAHGVSHDGFRASSSVCWFRQSAAPGSASTAHGQTADQDGDDDQHDASSIRVNRASASWRGFLAMAGAGLGRSIW